MNKRRFYPFLAIVLFLLIYKYCVPVYELHIHDGNIYRINVCTGKVQHAFKDTAFYSGHWKTVGGE